MHESSRNIWFINLVYIIDEAYIKTPASEQYLDFPGNIPLFETYYM